MPPSSSADGPPTAAAQSPSGWRFTWEAQSHSSTLRLLLFNSNTNPSIQCRDLNVNLSAERFLLTISFTASEETKIKTSVHVPVPRVLIDQDSPVHFRTFEDHIEVKLALLLPVDHPLVSDLDSVMDFEETTAELRSLSLDTDLKKLSSMGEVHFYCRSCSTKLTNGIRCFVEMPSVNWRDVADNWFGSCCCSFGGVGEKLVTKYAKSYACAAGRCLLNETSVLLSQNDVLGCEFPDMKATESCEPELNSTSYSDCNRVLADAFSTREHAKCGNLKVEMLNSVGDGITNILYSKEKVVANSKFKPSRRVAHNDGLSCTFPGLHIKEKEVPMDETPRDVKYHIDICSTGCCPSLDGPSDELLETQKVFLDGFLGNGFIVKSSFLSKDIKWAAFCCPGCSSLVGAYPCHESHVSLDGGIRLFKCCISTCLPSSGLHDTFGNYTLERMFAHQLLESAEEELSFLTIVRDIQIKSPVLQIVLLNPNTWCCGGCCVNPEEPVAKLMMYPTIKVLFSACSHGMEINSRGVDECGRKKEADEELYMFSSQLQELINGLELSNSSYPQSYRSLQGLLLSSMKR